MKKKQLLISGLLIFLLQLSVNPLLKAQTPDTINNLIVSEVFLGIHAGYSFAEFANAGEDTLDLMHFEVGSSNYESASTPYHDAVTRPWGPSWIILGEWLPDSKRYLAPGETVVLANANPSPGWCGNLEYRVYGNTDLVDIADLVFWRGDDTICGIEETPALPVYHWFGWTCQYVEYHSEGDSTVIDAVHNPINPDGTLDRGVMDVAGVENATRTHILARKGSVTEGNLDWEDARGTSLEDSEWMPIPLPLGYENDPWIKMYTTLGHFGEAHVNQESFSSDVVTVDYDNQVLTVPWGIYGDSLIHEFDLGGGLAWQYMLSGDREDSLHRLARTGDTLLMMAAGNTLEQVPFRIEVAEPEPDMALVFPVNTPGSGTAVRWSSPFVVTEDEPEMDSITGPFMFQSPARLRLRNPIPFATRVDTLFKYLEKAPEASWEIVWVDGNERADLKRGDILRVTAENGTTVKEYYLAVDTIPSLSTNANLASITWPDVPKATMEDPAWKHDTIPGFAPDQFDYKLQVPYGINTVPALVVKTQSLNATVKIDRANTLNGPAEDRTTIITVTAEEDSITNTYKILFEKELLPQNVQPFSPEPFFSQMVFWQFQAHYFFEIAHAGNQPLDLSNYMIATGLGGQTPSDVIQSGLSTDLADYEDRYRKFIPGYQYEKLEYWQLEPGNIIKDFNIDPIVQPNDVFLMGQFIMHRIGWGPPRYEACDIKWNNTDTWPEIWTEDERASSDDNVFSNIRDMNHPILLLKIQNDSIKRGTKPIGDPADFKVVDVFGGYSGNPWVANTDTINASGGNTSGWGLIRKPDVYEGNPVPEGSFAPTDEQSEWISKSRESLRDEFGGWMSQVEVSTGVGYHNYEPVTVYQSTVSSYNYIISEGYQTPQLIRGVVTGTSANDLLGNVIKADQGQELTVISGNDGSEVAGAAELANADTLEVISADGENITKYVINVSDEGLSSDALLSSDLYTIEVSDNTGTIAGLEYGTTIEEVLSNIDKPAGAKLYVVNAADELVPMQVMNYDTIMVPTQVDHNIFFEVIAEDMQTVIKYHLVPDVSPSDAHLYSNVFEVDQEVNLITYVPDGIRVPAFLSHVWLSEGASVKVVDKTGIEREIGPVKFDDEVVVTSEDGSTVNVYYLQFLEEIEGMDAYVLSNAFAVDEEEKAIYGLPETINMVVFMNSITPAKYATVRVIDDNGDEVTTNEIEAGQHKLEVTSGNGLKVVTYDLLISLPYTITFTVTDGTDPIEGANINVAGQILTTDASGKASISLPNGAYDYTAHKDDFAGSGTVTISDADLGEDIVVNQATYILTLLVTDRDGNPIENASISIAGSDLTTNASGEVSISVPNGDYSYSITADGYSNKTGDINISDANKDVEVQVFAVSVDALISDGISIYPNPSSGKIIINRPEHSGEMKVRLHDIAGSVVFVNEYPAGIQNSIKLDHLESGIYFLELKIDGKLHFSKLMIE